MKNILFILFLSFPFLFAQAQNGLENVYVERYYVTDATDAAYSIPPLPEGSVTYRIYADMLPGYKVQSIYGSPQHPLLMNTTTYFFNQSDYGTTIPTISATNTKKNTVMIDSWLSTGGACNGYLGVPKTEDDGVGNFVNSNVPPLLQNNAAQAGIPLTTQDGMLAGTVPGIITLGLDGIIDVFGDGSANGNEFYVTNGAWSCLSGASGPIPASNKVLIAQITTDGTFHFELNIQIGTPSLGTENYVASNPNTGELTIPSLTQTLLPLPLPPTVSITAPANNATSTIGAPISITADATDPDGTVSQVEFFVDGTSIGIAFSAPYTSTYTGLTAASHVLTAKATDNDGMFTISAPVNFYVVPNSFNVTFNVDMSRETISPDGVHISGSFNGWNPAQTPMVAGVGNVYSVTVPLPENQSHTYRFVNGNSISGLEIVPSDCGVPNGSGFYSRIVNILVNDTILDTVCFAKCSHCPVDVPITFNVDMSEQIISPEGVHLAGTFNYWGTSSIPMTAGANNIYSTTLLLTPGNYYLYKFVNGSDTTGYEAVPAECGSPSSSGGFDRYFTVPGNDSSLALHCFSSCVECGGVIENVDVTFRVDMSLSSVSSDGVHLTGAFQGWDPASTAMTVTDSIYTLTMQLPANTTLEYRFVNGITWNEAENVPSECSQSGNRYFLSANDTILPAVCFAKCSSCNVGLTDQISNELISGINPNPFNESAEINLYLPSPGFVKLQVYNTIGQLISTITEGNYPAGRQMLELEGKGLVPGFYFCNFHYHSLAGEINKTWKIIHK